MFMRSILKRSARVAATLFALVGALVFGSPNFANATQPNGNHYGNNNGNNGNHYGHVSGAPGPIAGAGLPIIAVGLGVYWLIRRRRKAE
jgi:hypothetical protein